MACIVVDAEPIFGAIYRPFYNETSELELEIWLKLKNAKNQFESVKNLLKIVDFHSFSLQFLAVFGLQGFGVISSDGHKISPIEESKTSKKVVVSRSHAGKVKEVVEKVFGNKMDIEPAGGSGYKTLRLVNGTAGKNRKF